MSIAMPHIMAKMGTDTSKAGKWARNQSFNTMPFLCSILLKKEGIILMMATISIVPTISLTRFKLVSNAFCQLSFILYSAISVTV
jgi:hypothetical protein